MSKRTESATHGTALAHVETQVTLRTRMNAVQGKTRLALFSEYCQGLLITNMIAKLATNVAGIWPVKSVVSKK